MSSIQTILHPTDFSENSAYAFDQACLLARELGARLILLHVVPAPPGVILHQLPPDPSECAEVQESLTDAFAWPEPSDPGILVEHRVAEGDAPGAILEVARRCNCDLIVIGTHGRSGWNRLLMGSVAEEVLRQAPCPVLTVRTPVRVSGSVASLHQEPLDPRDAGAYNSYAWLLATCPDQHLRDGKRAVEYATRACDLQAWKDPGCLDTLAAAYAEAGQFDQAVRWEKKALSFPEYAARQGERARRKLKLYEEAKPYRDDRFK